MVGGPIMSFPEIAEVDWIDDAFISTKHDLDYSLASVKTQEKTSSTGGTLISFLPCHVGILN